jgi:hypothetical protein
MDWLVKYYRKHGRRRERSPGSKKSSCCAHPPKHSRPYARRVEAGTWDQVRAEALKALEGANDSVRSRRSPCTRDVPELLSCSPDAAVGAGHYQWQVAQAAEEKPCAGSVGALCELVEHAIRGRDRRTYQQAVQYLKRMKAVYKSLNAVADWDAYLQSLRAQYRHLPALQDEMRQARL